MTKAAEPKEARPGPRLLEPFRLGPVTLTNRLVMLPHGTSMLRDGAPTDDDIAYFETRARGGPGLIITGAAVTGKDSTPRGGKLVRPYDDAVLEALARRVGALRGHGAAVVGQILHLGRETIGMEVDYVPVAPSPLRSPRDMVPPRALDVSEIPAIVAGFARSAANLDRTGHDGVEIHAAHGYLAAQFLSPATNLRDDAYGGSPDRRLRFLREVIAAIRQACRPDFVVGVRLSAEEQIPGGLTIEDSATIAATLAADGGLSYLSVTAGVRGAYVKDASQAEGFAVEAARRLRHASGLPTIAGQRILRPETIERILADGAADLVGMARGLIAEPDYLDRVRQGAATSIRPCIGVNQDCRAFAPHLHCAVNPRVGRERDRGLDDTVPSASRRLVAVIGGGPAGMEAAISAARRGHGVTLFEKAEALGGQMRGAAALPTRGELMRLIDYQAAELARLGVDVRLGAAAPPALEGYEAVIVAVGARAAPLPPALSGARTCADIVASGPPPPWGQALATVVDDGAGFWWTYGVADALVQAGWRLRVVTPSATIAAGIPAESLAPLLARLGRGAPEFSPLTTLESVEPGRVRLRRATHDAVEDLASDLVVVQTGRVSRSCPGDASPATVLRIGDALTPRRLSQAVHEGRRAGVQL